MNKDTSTAVMKWKTITGIGGILVKSKWYCRRNNSKDIDTVAIWETLDLQPENLMKTDLMMWTRKEILKVTDHKTINIMFTSVKTKAFPL